MNSVLNDIGTWDRSVVLTMTSSLRATMRHHRWRVAKKRYDESVQYTE